MTLEFILNPLMGGILIGISATLMLLFNGRITGVSGIVSSALARPQSKNLWRYAFLGGMVLGGLGLRFVNPDFFLNTSGRGLATLAFAGLLVGFGTVMGSGCTSGHGVCGISRFSIRSLVATVTFIVFGIAAVTLMRWFLGGP